VTESRRRRVRAAAGSVLAWLGVASLGGCSGTSGTRLDPMDLVAPEVSVDQERELGYQFDQAVQKQVRVIDDPVVAGFVNDLGRALLAGAGHQPHIYRFRVIQDDSLNAFALFGGYVYLHSGTLQAAGSVDELAAVLGHEIGHVKLRHHARMEKQSQLPKLLSTVAGIAGAVATGEPGVLLAAQGINVALELHWSREFEAEADREGLALVARAGMRPEAMGRFFARIVEVEKRDPAHIPPYLYSHPDVDKRIDTVDALAHRVEIVPHPTDELRREFAAAQERLAQLQQSGGAPIFVARPEAEPLEVAALLSAADEASRSEDHERALALLNQAAERAPDDPAVWFRIGELESAAGHRDAAARAFERNLDLDPTHALVFYRLGELTKAEGNAQEAIYAFEQAARRAGAKGTLRARANWEVIKLTFPLVVESGLSGPRDERSGPLGLAVDRYAAGARRLAWWGHLAPRYVDRAKDLGARWLPPGATTGEETPVKLHDRVIAATELDLPEPGASAGTWTLEILLDGDPVLRRAVQVGDAAPQ
jgi:predicted Zn-dependent protease